MRKGLQKTLRKKQTPPRSLAIQTLPLVKPAAKLTTVFCAGKQMFNDTNSRQC